MKEKLAKSFLQHNVKSFLIKKEHTFLVLFLLVTGAYGQAKLKAKAKLQPGSFGAVETSFINIPDSVQTSVYWYWISGNISKEGVVKDLEAMKKVGINRAFIGNIGLDNVPGGKVKMFTDEWWDILDAALKTATRLNIQIGIFNGPGWSQSGGPWVKPGQSMRYLTSSQVTVQGPLALHQKLDQPQKEFQDVKVLAYPVPAGYGAVIHAQLSSIPAIDSLNNLTDNNPATAIHLHNGQQFSLDINTTAPDTIRSIIINTTQQPVYLEGEIQAKTNGDYVTIKHFDIDRTNPALNTGFTPYGPAAISIPATKSTGIRLVFTRISN
ncbi:MAG TPA: glycosyl hydrolase, partial [Mucilaginibacter sp.]|nr:glycosyl hydrolase [Mucilaginibacter sp.]